MKLYQPTLRSEKSLVCFQLFFISDEGDIIHLIITFKKIVAHDRYLIIIKWIKAFSCWRRNEMRNLRNKWKAISAAYQPIEVVPMWKFLKKTTHKMNEMRHGRTREKMADIGFELANYSVLLETEMEKRT